MESYGILRNESAGPKQDQPQSTAGPMTKTKPNLKKWRHAFAYKGRSCHLFKRADSITAPYYIKIQREKKEFKQSLETPDRTVAIHRAKQFIDDIDGQKWADVERRKVRHRASNLADVLKVYRTIHGLKQRSARNNELAMFTILRRVTGKDKIDPKRVPLSYIDRSLALRFQDIMAAEYCSVALRSDGAQREARERAFRSSRSTLNQARSLFTRQAEHDLCTRYKDAGLHIPDNIQDFMTVKLRGSRSKSEYNPVPDAVIDETFAAIEKLKDRDVDVYLAFWLAVGAGLRRGELLLADWSHFVERGGMTWIAGGIGKDGETINVPIQSKAWAALKPFRKDKGQIVKGAEVAKRLNHWLRFQGWDTQKKMHELRAYVGSLIYRVSPTAAMQFMRHKSIAVTERFYVRYGHTQPVNVL